MYRINESMRICDIQHLEKRCLIVGAVGDCIANI